MPLATHFKRFRKRAARLIQKLSATDANRIRFNEAVAQEVFFTIVGQVRFPNQLG